MSKILKDENILKNFTNLFPPKTEFLMVYQGSEDTFKSKIFHQNCDNQGSTVIVV
jgi:hypothetical protein